MDWREFVITRIKIFLGRTVESLNRSELQGLIPWMEKVKGRWETEDDQIRTHYAAFQRAMEEAGIQWEARERHLPDSGAAPQITKPETPETSNRPLPPAPIETPKSSVSDVQPEQPEQVPSPRKEGEARETVSEEAESYQRAPLEEIIGHYGIAGIHPAAELLPEISDEEFQQMSSDIKTNGLLHPPSINDEGILLDGRTRLQAAWALGLDLKFERINPQDAVAYVLSENIRRRHLSAGQKALIAEELAKLPRGNPQFGNRRIGYDDSGTGSGISRYEAAGYHPSAADSRVGPGRSCSS